MAQFTPRSRPRATNLCGKSFCHPNPTEAMDSYTQKSLNIWNQMISQSSTSYSKWIQMDPWMVLFSLFPWSTAQWLFQKIKFTSIVLTAQKNHHPEVRVFFTIGFRLVYEFAILYRSLSVYVILRWCMFMVNLLQYQIVYFEIRFYMIYNVLWPIAIAG